MNFSEFWKKFADFKVKIGHFWPKIAQLVNLRLAMVLMFYKTLKKPLK